MIIVVGGTKGGTGKSTIATNLAVLSSQKKMRTLLIDADEQHSSFEWSEQRYGLWKDNQERSIAPIEAIMLSGKHLY
jgi:cellulose biosynthesis protein BcsQ